MMALYLAVAAASFAIPTTGLRWSLHFHPDEETIAKWMDDSLDNGYIKDRAYPSGWFELFRLVEAIKSKCGKIGRRLSEHSRQDGLVDALVAKSYQKAYGDYGGTAKHTVQDGRDFNALLHILAMLFLFSAFLEFGIHPLAAFASTLAVAANPFIVEAVHYCETDEATVFSFSLWAWLAAKALRRDSAPLGALAAAAAGFGTASKFSLAPLLIWCLAFPASTWRMRDGGLRGKVAAASCQALLLIMAAAAGYAIGTPAMLQAPDWYFTDLKRIKALTYAEININLGGHPTFTGACAIRLASMAGIMKTLGLAPLLLFSLGWAFSFRQGRTRAMLLASLPPLFLILPVLAFPFVRRQELLPFILASSLAAGLPADWLIRRIRNGGLRAAARPGWALAASLALAAFLISGLKGLGMASAFASRDTRVQARNWLNACLAENRQIGLDNYVRQVARGVKCKPMAYDCLPCKWGNGQTQGASDPPFEYYVENVGFHGREPIRDLGTGRILPGIRQSMERYKRETFVLKEWAISRCAITPTFAQPRVRLVGTRPPKHTRDLTIATRRPIVMLPDG